MFSVVTKMRAYLKKEVDNLSLHWREQTIPALCLWGLEGIFFRPCSPLLKIQGFTQETHHHHGLSFIYTLF